MIEIDFIFEIPKIYDESKTNEWPMLNNNKWLSPATRQIW